MGVPQVTPISESRHTGGFVVWDPSDGMITRESILLLSGAGVCTTGLVLGAELLSGTATSAALGTNTGNGVMGAVTVTAPAKIGDYKLTILQSATNAGAFMVEGPDGTEVGHGNVAAAFSAGGLAFTLADGATDFVSGDSFTISVTGTVKYAGYDPTATNGLQFASAILWSGYRDATSADKKAVAIVRGPARVNASELVWGANVTTTPQKTAALAALAKLGILNT